MVGSLIYAMATTTTETTYGLTYSVARAIGVTAWQSITAVCHCCLTHGYCHWIQDLFWLQEGGYQQRMWTWLECFHHSMPSPYDLQEWYFIACVQHVLARPDSQFLCVSYNFLCDICSLRFSNILISHVHATGPHFSGALTYIITPCFHGEWKYMHRFGFLNNSKCI